MKLTGNGDVAPVGGIKVMSTKAEISNSEDYLDVRDIIARFEELEGSPVGQLDEADPLAEELEDDRTEFLTLKSLLEDLKGNGGDEEWREDWYPVTLIRDSYFETAMDDLLEDIGDLPKNLPCYLKIEVDYDALQSDYTSVEYDGVTYWYR